MTTAKIKLLLLIPATIATLVCCSTPNKNAEVQPLVVKKIQGFDLTATIKQVREQLLSFDNAGLANSIEVLKSGLFQLQNVSQNDADFKKIIELIELISFNYYLPKDVQAIANQMLNKFSDRPEAFLFELRLLDRLARYDEINSKIDSYNQKLATSFAFQQFVIQTLINQGKVNSAESKLLAQYYDKPKDKYFFNYLFLIALKSDLKFKAKIILDKMKQVVKEEPNIFYLEALLQIQNKNYAEARTTLEKYMPLMPLDLEAKFNYWLVLFKLNQRDLLTKALTPYQAFTVLPPAQTLSLAKLWMALNRYELAKPLLTRLTSQFNQFTEALLLEGIVLHDLDRNYSKAAEKYQQYISTTKPKEDHPVFTYLTEANQLLGRSPSTTQGEK